MSRPTTGVALLEKYEGEAQSIRRMQAIIETLSGHRSVIDVCQELGINEAMFRRIRDVCLQAAITSIDPKKRGRKPAEPEPGADRIHELEREIKHLQRELFGARVRIELLETGCARPKRTEKKTTTAMSQPMKKTPK